MSTQIDKRFLDKVKKTPGCWEWVSPSKYKNGYGCMYFYGKLTGAHRVSYQLYKGKIPDGMCVCHTCDNRSCVNPDHLWLGTASDNLRDMYKKKRQGHRTPYEAGEKHFKSAFTNKQVESIRDFYKSGNFYLKDLALKYKVSISCISKIIRNKRYVA